jgi:hypothetical protein
MPLAFSGRPKDAVVVAAAGSDWRAGVAAFLSTLTTDPSRVDAHLALLDDRLAGRLDWRVELADARLPDGRPMPTSRRYAELLVQEGRLPLYDVGPIRMSVDLHNPGNEAGVAGYDPDLLELAIVADVRYFSSITPGSVFDSSLGFETVFRQRAEHGAILGDLVARLVDALAAPFAYTDISSTGWVVTNAPKKDIVVHPAPPSVRPRDFLWSITAWGETFLEPRLEERLEHLAISPEIMGRVDSYARPHVRLERRRLASGALFIQYRFLFGSEGRGERAALDTPLAKQAGLRSTNLLFRA